MVRCNGAHLPHSGVRLTSRFCILTSLSLLSSSPLSLLSPFFSLVSLFCLLTADSCLLLSPLSAEETRPGWAWDGGVGETNAAAEPGPFRWSWQPGGGTAPVSPETGLRRAPAGDPAAFEGLVRENVALRREVERALRQLHESRQAQAALEAQVRDLEQKRASLAASLREVRTSDEVLAELARIRSEREALARDNERLKQRLEAASAAVSAPAPAPLAPPPGSDLFKKIERENLDLKVELAALKQSAREVEAAQAKLEELQQERGAQAEQSVRERAELQARMERLQEGKTASDQAVERWSRQAREAAREAESLRARVAEIEAELKAAREPAKAGSEPDPAAGEVELLRAADGPGAKGEDAEAAKALRLAQRGKYREAEKLYRRALDRTPEDPALHFNLGILYQEGLRSPTKAVVHFRKYLELAPTARDADQVRAWINELEMGF